MTRCDTVSYFTPRMTELAAFYRNGLQLGKPQGHGGNHLGFRLDKGVYLGFDRVDEAQSSF